MLPVEAFATRIKSLDQWKSSLIAWSLCFKALDRLIIPEFKGQNVATPAKYLRKCVDRLILVTQNSPWSLDRLLKERLISFRSQLQTFLQATSMWLPLALTRSLSFSASRAECTVCRSDPSVGTHKLFFRSLGLLGWKLLPEVMQVVWNTFVTNHTHSFLKLSVVFQVMPAQSCWIMGWFLSSVALTVISAISIGYIFPTIILKSGYRYTFWITVEPLLKDSPN